MQIIFSRLLENLSYTIAHVRQTGFVYIRILRGFCVVPVTALKLFFWYCMHFEVWNIFSLILAFRHTLAAWSDMQIISSQPFNAFCIESIVWNIYHVENDKSITQKLMFLVIRPNCKTFLVVLIDRKFYSEIGVKRLCCSNDLIINRQKVGDHHL